MSEIFLPSRERLVMPFLSPVYEKFAEPVGWLGFRVVVGLSLVVAGWPKIVAPLAQSGFVESLGMYPGWFWSPLLAAMQFFGGMLIAVGFLTRPIALANAVMLLITLWFHMAHPYPEPFLTPEGISYLTANPDLLTPGAQAALLKDGGIQFGARIQEKAIYASLFWAAGAALIAAFGGGYFSVDRALKKEF
ncbi:DoxX family protein [Sinirhodobacter sp. WL0062]|uniref:DoxX family protein n=1 Tax=Rhodobacter flavimaris TaxID=2907145 RepID=A0ABS8YV98_9RHOB|nr:DoxX family protein [Sinirhodobacter sp. WL0062]MCE5972371.1 DoxX family protein [Sinirhodobacter sp. WL0062]